MKYYLNNFLIYSILGFILETSLKHTIFPGMNNGTLYGPWIQIYGFGVCLIIIIMRFIFNRVKANKFVKTILVFLISAFTLTLLEFIGGHLIELLTNEIFWDYSDLKFHIGHYIALEISLVWGVASIIVMYIIKPLTDKLIKKIPNILTYLVFIIFLVDFVISTINNMF